MLSYEGIFRVNAEVNWLKFNLQRPMIDCKFDQRAWVIL